MRIDIIAPVPELLESPLNYSIMQRAKDRNILEVEVHDLRQYGLGKHKQIDDYAYGGGAGMVLMAEPLANCIDKLLAIRKYDEIIYMSPDGILLKQPMCNRMSMLNNLMIICGHYKGIDERIRAHYITMEISIGDYVLSGGELAAAVLIDALGRLIPGVLNDETSALSDSFQDNLVAPPVYTRPSDFRGMKVPDVLLGGNHHLIDEWKYQQAIDRTRLRRPELLQEED